MEKLIAQRDDNRIMWRPDVRVFLFVKSFAFAFWKVLAVDKNCARNYEDAQWVKIMFFRILYPTAFQKNLDRVKSENI